MDKEFVEGLFLKHNIYWLMISRNRCSEQFYKFHEAMTEVVKDYESSDYDSNVYTATLIWRLVKQNYFYRSTEVYRRLR